MTIAETLSPEALAAAPTREACAAADAADPLARFRSAFVLPEGVVYLDGNSLGAQPVRALDRSLEVLRDEWGQGLIRSWNAAGWFELPLRLGNQLAPLIGAAQDEVAVTDTISLNLFKVLAAALRLQRDRHPERRVIVAERDSFPTDLYMIEGLVDFLQQGYALRLVDEALPLEAALADDVAVVLLSHVNYRTGLLHDMAALTALAHERGALAVWDLAHSAGAVPVDLGGAGADFAVGCTYKYLNAGPGAPGFVWVPRRHQDACRQPLSGWWGHARPFAMAPDYRPAEGIRRFLCGTQPVLSLALVACGLELTLEAGMDALRRKSMALTDLFIRLVERRCAGHGLVLATPREPGRRGSQVSFRHAEGFAVMQALIARGVIGDYREPGILRFGFTPLYLRHVDVWDAAEALRDILDQRRWDRPEFHKRISVT